MFFKRLDTLVDKRCNKSGLYVVDTVDYDNIFIFSCDTANLFWAKEFFYRLATTEEIAAGHRINNDSSKPEMHSHLTSETLKNDDEWVK